MRTILRTGRYPLYLLADIYAVAPRTIRRDLLALQEAGEPMHMMKDDEGVTRWWIK